MLDQGSMLGLVPITVYKDLLCLDIPIADSIVEKDMQWDTRGKRNASYSRVGCIRFLSQISLFIHAFIITNQHKLGINRVQVTF
jgi:hypothetical protein